MSIKSIDADDYSLDDFDEVNSPRPEATDMEKIILSRRTFLKGSVAGAAAFLMSQSVLAKVVSEASSRLAFQQVTTNGLDTVTVPKGYSWHIVGSWGDPLWSKGTDFDHTTRGTAESQLLSMGDNTDGMSLFVKNGRSIIAQNNEYVNRSIIYGNRGTKLPENEDDINKGKAGHGVSIFEVEQKNGKWVIIKIVLTSEIQVKLSWLAGMHSWAMELVTRPLTNKFSMKNDAKEVHGVIDEDWGGKEPSKSF